MAAVVAGCILFSQCSERDAQLGSIPATLSVGGAIRLPGRQTTELRDGLVAIGRRYRLRVDASPSPNGREWQVQIKCDETLIGVVSTARKGDVILGSLFIYGFKDAKDFDRFSDEFLKVFSRYVAVDEVKRGQILTEAELAARAKYIGEQADFSSRCSPPARPWPLPRALRLPESA